MQFDNSHTIYRKTLNVKIKINIFKNILKKSLTIYKMNVNIQLTKNKTLTKGIEKGRYTPMGI